MKTGVNSARGRWGRCTGRRLAALGWILPCALLMSGCIFGGPKKPEVRGYAMPQSLLTCRVPARFVRPEEATPGDVGIALIDTYDAWEDCHDTVGRIRRAQAGTGPRR